MESSLSKVSQVGFSEQVIHFKQPFLVFTLNSKLSAFTNHIEQKLPMILQCEVKVFSKCENKKHSELSFLDLPHDG